MTDYTIAPVSPEIRAAVRAALDAKTKPRGSLGQIEALALQLALAQHDEAPSPRATLLLCAGDHGLTAEGVSAWPSEVTAQMVLNFLGGGAAANVFARQFGVEVRVIDAGVAADLPDHPELIRAGIRRGAGNALREDALTPDEVERALEFGGAQATRAVRDGAKVIMLGEMGIGNTATAALLAHAVSGVSLNDLVGPGAGLDERGVAHKLDVLERCVRRRPGPMAPDEALVAFGGLEIAVMAGAMIGAAAAKAAVVVDGYISTAAAMLALDARPEARPYLIFAHQGAEPGHGFMLDHLDVDALLDLDLRLGEGTGALLTAPLIRAACAMLAEMATFEDAGVSGRVA